MDVDGALKQDQTPQAAPAEQKKAGVHEKYRGKLYTLSKDAQWEDAGTGYIRIHCESGIRRLTFREEHNGAVLLDRPIFDKDAYQLQGEKSTIIVWEDPETQKDWALSFQDPQGTTEVYAAICSPTPVTVPPPAEKLLPQPSLKTLKTLVKLLAFVTPAQRDTVASECLCPNFISGLRDTFHKSENMGSEENLSSLWHIVKSIFVLSYRQLTERYLQPDVYEDMMGILEYDLGLPEQKRIRHRQILREQVRFQDVVSLEDGEMIQRIHLNYRLQYLKDIVLPRHLDDGAFVALTQMIHWNITTILDQLKNASLLQRLFTQIREKDLLSLAFLQDACRLAVKIPPKQRQALYIQMVELNLFEVLVPFLGDGTVEGETETLRPRHIAIEILLHSALNDSRHLCTYMASMPEQFASDGSEGHDAGRRMLSALIRQLLTEVDQAVQGQIAEMLKAIMDPQSMEQRERDRALDFFYIRGGFEQLVAPLQNPPVRCSIPASFGLQLVCELLAFAVLQHGYRAKSHVLRHNLGHQAMRLLSQRQRFLQLAPVRLLRAMVATQDEGYHQYIVQKSLFAPLMRSFAQNLQPPALGGNLFVSAVLELIELIRHKNYKILVSHICEKHADVLKAFGAKPMPDPPASGTGPQRPPPPARAPPPEEYKGKFLVLGGLLLRHEQNLEYEKFPPEQHAAGGPIAQPGGRSGRPVTRRRSPGREDDDDDEAYFDSLDDDDDDDVGPKPAAAGDGHMSGQPAATGDRGAQGRGTQHFLSGAPILGCDPDPTGTPGTGASPTGRRPSQVPTAGPEHAPAFRGLGDYLANYEDDDEEPAGAVAPTVTADAAREGSSADAVIEGASGELSSATAADTALATDGRVAGSEGASGSASVATAAGAASLRAENVPVPDDDDEGIAQGPAEPEAEPPIEDAPAATDATVTEAREAATSTLQGECQAAEVCPDVAEATSSAIEPLEAEADAEAEAQAAKDEADVEGEGEETEAGAPGTGGERSLNHVSKRLKTSNSESSASAS